MSSLAGIGLVLLLLFGAAWLMRRGTFGFGLTKPRALTFSVETAFSLGERRSLAVVSVEGRRLLLGLTPANISLITELPRAATGFDTTLDRQLSRDANA